MVEQRPEKPCVAGSIPALSTMKQKILNTYTAVFVKDGDMYAAYAEELPGANTQGKTIDEAKENLKEAISMIIEANIMLSRKSVSRRKFLREKILVSL